VKVLVSWLRELVDVAEPVEALAQRLHLAGFELASITPIDEPSPLRSSAIARGLAEGPDAVIDFEITANRPDALSMVGLAREVATLYDRPLRWTPAHLDRPPDPAIAGPLRVTIEDGALCPRYTAALAVVEVGPSPDWLVARLTAAGIRSINNIVDVTNYVLLETGHPLHAFDLAKLAGPHLRIRRAAAGETVTTLDGQTRSLAPGMLVIADAERAQALAGVMGGADSEVSGETTTIVLESAYFHPPSIRRTSRRLGLSTEASYRFERGADPEAPAAALARACALIEEIGAGRVHRDWIDARAQAHAPQQVTLRATRLRRVLGYEVPPAAVERLLRGLGFGLATAAGGEAGPAWQVTVPSWRIDVAREADLIEEVARVEGYDRAPESFPALHLAPPRPDPRLARDATLRTLARAAGYSESVTFSFIEREAALRYAADTAIVRIANPLSESFAVLRPTLLAGLMDSVAHNRRREQRDVRLFELATRFTTTRGEHRALGLAWTGQSAAVHWSGSGRGADLYDLLGTIDRLCQGIGLEAEGAPDQAPFLTAATATRVQVRPRRDPEATPIAIGLAGQLEPSLADAHGLPPREAVFVAELDLDLAQAWIDLGERVRATALPRFPSSARDISIVIPASLPAAAVRGTIRRAAPATLERVREFDRYQGKGVPDDCCSLSLRLTFRAADRTLTDAEVQAAMEAIVDALRESHGATLRQ
jgi:phenylalanyl-tRNA synthetase beta chain